MCVCELWFAKPCSPCVAVSKWENLRYLIILHSSTWD
ncbi:hypothetical protein SLEP1_g47910 [Rubroshorea leprosula]|uniref:Uncharacterized protein n=1 Tax=Rubroshorea leprosula TaxID=152421 RepID=A0AAV5LUA9_9ROSI|nr:hypothetical protein SLEP1_g47910 [Rubroshorea leprosula]